MIASELRQAFRSLSSSPATSLNIPILSQGAGGNTGAFSASCDLLLKPLPYPDPGHLGDLHETAADRQPRGVALRNLLDCRAGAERFEGMAASQPRTFGLTRGEREGAMR